MSYLDQLTRAHQGGPRLHKSIEVAQSLDEAYQFQSKLIKLETQNHNHLKGYKISLTSKETQDLFDAEEPLYGALTEDSVIGGQLQLEHMSEPLIEVELMFLVKEDIHPEDDEMDIIRKTQVAPGIEIPDSRYEDWFPHLSLNQIVTDRAVAGKVVVGEHKHDLTFEQLNSINVSVTLNNELIATGHSSEVLGNPVYAVKWLAQQLAKTGETLQSGMVISSGTFYDAPATKEGSL
ncbi:2-keto-4-pentenoate hydratase [Piscibacillus salipiscarius]|uniref:2-keto-4-pentenoate hydratase n=1 Tax=Piscibacillus salipiscarius TaxID=299480 RepID=UPI0006D20827|nr:hypothetical protein [Piscibacillus salipiscarius]